MNQTNNMDNALREIIHLQERGNLVDAERKCRNLLERVPNHAVVVHLLGLIECQQGFADAGLREIEHSIALEPRNSEFHNNLSGILGQLGRLDDAIRAGRRAIELNPSFGLAHFNLALNFENARNSLAAEDFYRRATTLMPDHLESQYRLGCVLHQLERYEESEELHFRLFELSRPPLFNSSTSWPVANPKALVVVTCKGRVSHLRQTLTQMLEFQYAHDYRVVVIDYGDPDNAFEWCRSLQHPRLICVRILDKTELFHKARAFNCGANVIPSDILCFVDADSVLDPSFLQIASEPIREGKALLARRERTSKTFDTVGTCCVRTSAYRAVRGYDEEIQGYGPEDLDFFARVRQIGQIHHFPARLYPHSIQHSAQERARYYAPSESEPSARKILKQSIRRIVQRLLDKTRVINPGEYGCGESLFAAVETKFVPQRRQIASDL